MIFIWTSEECCVAPLINEILLAYMMVQHSDLDAFLVASKDAYSADLVSADFGVDYADVANPSAPGWSRLEFKTNRHFQDHWFFLWKCVCNVLCRASASSSVAHALRHISVDHFSAQTAQEDMAMFFARLRRAYSDAQGELKV